VVAFTASTHTFPTYEPAPPTPLAKVKLLRQWAWTMQQRMPEVVAKGGYIPLQFPSHAHR
jgi:hypothetical protein